MSPPVSFCPPTELDPRSSLCSPALLRYFAYLIAVQLPMTLFIVRFDTYLRNFWHIPTIYVRNITEMTDPIIIFIGRFFSL